MFTAVLCEAAYAVIGKKLTGQLSPKRITALINLWGFALMTPLGLYAALRFDFSSVGAPSWLLLVFYSLAASVWTVMLPISAAVVGVVFLGEPLGGIQLVAFGIALVGVLLATVGTAKTK